ncbi:integrase catalytic domain-containing protein [Trichonephila clavipes]|nr:integrase catalytic domain-containing protein [Trichonephila clavipes]
MDEKNSLKEYASIFDEWEALKIIEKVSETEIETDAYYLPHRAVFKISETTKIRPVFDATAREGNNLSLNDCLLRGPNLIELIPDILDTFRMYPIGLSANIENAFLQISVTPDYRDFLRIWESNVEKESVSKCEGDTNVLGLTWNLDRDTLRCTVNNAILEKLTEMTKRTILLTIQGIFDPLGILTAATLLPNMWSQETWKVKLAWDSPLPLGLCNKFDKWFKEILLLQNLKIPRYCEMNSDSDLHVFVDASKNAYAASIFVRTKLASGIKLHLLRAKARVAPTKSVSMPRGAVREFKNLDWIKIERETEIQRIKWKFNPPTTAWWGGWWERLIRVLNDLLKRTLGNAVLKYEELLTVLCDCESIVNSHPLTYVSEDSDDLITLTPAMFMMSNSFLDVTDLDLSDFAGFQKRVKFRARLLKDLRGRFRKKYLRLLVQKAHKTTRALKVGEIGLIESPNKRRLYWHLGKYTEMGESNDVSLDAEALKIPSASVDVSESAMIPVNAYPNMPKV